MIGGQGEIKDSDLDLVKEWIRKNGEKVVDIWRDDIHAFEPEFTRVRCTKTTGAC